MRVKTLGAAAGNLVLALVHGDTLPAAGPLGAALLAIVVGWMVLALVRFRARPDEATEPPQIHGNRTMELVWTIVPAVTLATVFVSVVSFYFGSSSTASGVGAGITMAPGDGTTPPRKQISAG